MKKTLHYLVTVELDGTALNQSAALVKEKEMKGAEERVTEILSSTLNFEFDEGAVREMEEYSLVTAQLLAFTPVDASLMITPKELPAVS